jgi:hypothetical protein
MHRPQFAVEASKRTLPGGQVQVTAPAFHQLAHEIFNQEFHGHGEEGWFKMRGAILHGATGRYKG